MADFLESFQDPRILDPLSDVTRRERKSLLFASLIGLAIAKGGLIPQEISALGIKVSTFERISLLYLLVLVLLYFILGFALYAAADLKGYRMKVHEAANQRREAIEHTLGPQDERAARVSASVDRGDVEKIAILVDRANIAEDVLKIARLRYLFEFYLPLAVGWVSVGLTLAQAKGYPGFSWMVSLAISVAVAMIIGYYMQVHDRLKRKYRSWKQNRPMRRVMKKMRRANSLPENSEKRKRLMNEVSRLIDQMARPNSAEEKG